ncbi:CLEC3A [Mytilus edulis]|uniref:CLEC3A n=1 Tax=Mytilus edulis TaxID=6550 RepID=A0A8S3RGT5_MYTED|nr:CLEC3A [Mytilus edulis]
MTIRSFLYCTTVYCIATCLLNLVKTNAKEVILQATGSTRALQSKTTVDVDSASKIECALQCLSNRECCLASFSEGTSTCRIDNSEKCDIKTETINGWTTIRRNIYFPMTNSRSISFGNSKYCIIKEQEEWMKANESCQGLGGKLVELETQEENEFIKNDVMTLSSGVEGYWIGGYNFNNDGDLEWLSKPNQAMPITDWNMQTYPQPDGLLTQHCVMIWRSFDFRWCDHYCNTPLSYICEFTHQ